IGLIWGAALVAGTYGLIALGLPIIGAYLLAINLLAFAAYAFDKRRAGAGGRRVPEAVLLGLAYVGGTPGAGLAMFTLRHKTRKLSFLIPFLGAILVQAAGLGFLAWIKHGDALMRQFP